MIVEYIRYSIDEAERGAFEDAYSRAQTALIKSTHCLAYELSQCAEDGSLGRLAADLARDPQLRGRASSGYSEPF